MGKKKRKIPTRQPARSANVDLAALEEVNQRIEAIKLEREGVLANIRSGFRDVVVVFVDMVGSTQFKIDHRENPEIWVLRVRQFGEIIAEYVDKLGGKVVKYIGDEVMAVFDDDSRVNDACNFVARIAEIQANLKKATEFETQIKIAIDKGDVCFLEYAGHEPIDPQGTAIDRCARIGKKTAPGVVLASHEFVTGCPSTYQWTKAGSVDFRGLGSTLVYQMGNEVSVDMTPRIELPEPEYKWLQERVSQAEIRCQELELDVNRLSEMNEGLQNEIRNLGSDPTEQNSVSFEDDSTVESRWDIIEAEIIELKRLIERAPCQAQDYARFIFLAQSGDGDEFSDYERDFRGCIESKIVEEHGDGYYYLSSEHPLNDKVREVTGRLNEKLEEYEGETDDYYRFALDDPQFWSDKIGYCVI